jgi:hypothetical protein
MKERKKRLLREKQISKKKKYINEGKKIIKEKKKISFFKKSINNWIEKRLFQNEKKNRKLVFTAVPRVCVLWYTIFVSIVFRLAYDPRLIIFKQIFIDDKFRSYEEFFLLFLIYAVTITN